jgi:hypothetical protein
MVKLVLFIAHVSVDILVKIKTQAEVKRRSRKIVEVTTFKASKFLHTLCSTEARPAYVNHPNSWLFLTTRISTE